MCYMKNDSPGQCDLSIRLWVNKKKEFVYNVDGQKNTNIL
jgi:hypothetical protein